MSRREFMKALAGIPLLALLVKAPEQQEEFKPIFPGDPGYIDVTVDDKGKLNLIMPGDPDYIDVSVTSQWHTMTYEGNRLVSDDGVLETAHAELQAGAEGQPPLSITIDRVNISEHVASWSIRDWECAMANAIAQNEDNEIMNG